MFMNVGFKKFHENARLPEYAHPMDDVGLDLFALENGKIKRDKNGLKITYRTGIGIQLPSNHVGLIFPRSSIKKYSLHLSNSVGVIDPGFQGEILVSFNLITASGNLYNSGDKIAQLIILPFPRIQPVEITQFAPSLRGSGGFGSTGG